MSEEADKGFEQVWQSARQDGGGTCGLQSQVEVEIAPYQ